VLEESRKLIKNPACFLPVESACLRATPGEERRRRKRGGEKEAYRNPACFAGGIGLPEGYPRRRKEEKKKRRKLIETRPVLPVELACLRVISGEERRRKKRRKCLSDVIIQYSTIRVKLFL